MYRPLRPRPGRDPDLPVGRPRACASAIRRSSRSELDLRLGGERVVLRPLAHRVSERPGAGGLPTLRFEAVYAASLRGSAFTFVDRSFASRIGWREVTVRARDGARLVSSSVPAASRSDELRSYPRDLLRSPLAFARRRRVSSPGRRPLRLRGSTGRRRRATRATGSRGSSGATTRRSASFFSPCSSRRSGVPRTLSRPGTGRRSSPATSSAPAAGRGTPSRSEPRSR